MKPFDTIKRETIYNGKIFDVVKDTVYMPTGKEANFDLVLHGGATAIVAIDEDRIVFVRQNRYATGDYVLEIPAGRLEKDEDPKECAIRELEEETGFIAKDIEFMFKSYSAIGFSNEIIHYYLAENLSKGKQNLDENEFVDIESYTLDEAIKMIFDGSIIDNKTISAILAYKEIINNRK